MKKNKILLAVAGAVFAAALMMPGRAVIEINLGLDDVAQAVGTAAIMVVIVWAVLGRRHVD